MRKSILLVSVISLMVLSACSPAVSESKVQTAIAQTQAAAPTETPIPTNTLAPTSTPLPSATPTPAFEKWTASQIQEKIIAAGLEFANPAPMTKDDYGMAPMAAKEGIHFFLPSLCSDCGGRLFSFESQEDLNLMKQYYTDLGKQSAAFFSWVFVKDNILIQINGDYPESKANIFKDFLNSLQ